MNKLYWGKLVSSLLFTFLLLPLSVQGKSHDDSSDRLPVETSSVSVLPKSLAYGDMAKVVIRIANTYDMDLEVTVEALINSTALFLNASDGGKIADPHRDPVADQTIRWTKIPIPENRAGILKMNILTRDGAKGDLGIHVKVYANEYAESHLMYFHAFVSPSLGQVQPHESGSEAVFIFVLFLVIIFLVSMALATVTKFSHGFKMTAGRVSAGVLSLSTALILMSGVADLLEPYTSFEKTKGTILDRRYYLESPSASDSRNRRGTVHAVPIASVSYAVDSRTIYAADFAKQDLALSDLEQFAIGSEVDVWYNPDYPKDFVLVRYSSVGSLVFLAIFTIIFVILGRFALHPKNSLISKIISQFKGSKGR